MLSCSFDECSQIWTQTTDYFQVVGIILGQLTVGFLGDWLGRRWGMVQVCRLAWRVLHFPALLCPALPCLESVRPMQHTLRSANGQAKALKHQCNAGQPTNVLAMLRLLCQACLRQSDKLERLQCRMLWSCSLDVSCWR